MILLDTHVVIWLAELPEELSADARSAIQQERARGGLAISDKTLWEIALLISRGRVVVKTSRREFLLEVERLFQVFPVTGEIAERAVLFSDRYPRDPADRIIGATALTHAARLITRDERIRASGEVECLW